jgi:hypothetical protein
MRGETHPTKCGCEIETIDTIKVYWSVVPVLLSQPHHFQFDNFIVLELEEGFALGELIALGAEGLDLSFHVSYVLKHEPYNLLLVDDIALEGLVELMDLLKLVTLHQNVHSVLITILACAVGWHSDGFGA